MKMMMNNNYGRKQTVLLFPWLGHGHLSPFLELAKKLSNTNLFDIYFCSTPANLDLIKRTLTTKLIQLVELNLPCLPDLPPYLHTTDGLPLHLMPTLKQAFGMASTQFSVILETLKPDLLIYDIIQPWAPVAANEHGIPSVVFITTTAAACLYHHYLNSPNTNMFPFSTTIYYREYELVEVLENSGKGKDLITECVSNSSSIALVKSFNEIEGKYVDYLSVLTGKKIVPVGPLVVDPYFHSTEPNNVIQWLNTKATRSTVFVSFGSEYFLSDVDMEEIAYGLENSYVDFVWVLRFPEGDVRNFNIAEALPLGFLERVNNRGLLVEGWAPQPDILRHKSIGGFVTHCGWNSVVEAMKFGVPVIAMPMHLDQPINARLVAEIGVGVEVVRHENGQLKRENVAEIVQQVVVSSLGEVVREKAKKLSVDMNLKGDEEIDVAVNELLKLCKSGDHLRRLREETVIDISDLPYDEEEKEGSLMTRLRGLLNGFLKIGKKQRN